MMGLQAAPEQLFYVFFLENHVPADHIFWKIDHFLDLGDAHTKLVPPFLARPRRFGSIRN